LSWASLDSSAN